jgi:heme-degrading monooxygenase HmoA
VEFNYYAVIFSSSLSDLEDLKYIEFSKKMLENVNSQNRFIEIESYREKSGKGVTISYWKSIAAIQEWREHSAHLRVHKYGCEVTYSNYSIKIWKVQREYNFKRTDVKDRNS